MKRLIELLRGSRGQQTMNAAPESAPLTKAAVRKLLRQELYKDDGDLGYC